MTNTGPGTGGGADPGCPAHRDQEAVQVPGLRGVLGLRWLAQQLRQTLHTGHPDNVDVVVTAEGLNECEVDLQGNVILLLLVNGQQAQDHAVRVPEGPKEGVGSAGGLGRAARCTGEFA